MASSRYSRRRFMKGTSGAAAAAVIGAPTIWVRGADAPSGKLNVAVIGALGKGESDRGNVAKEHNIVALCDVDMSRAEDGANKHMKQIDADPTDKGKAPKLYQDFRKMFDEMGKNIDLVFVSTPDHTHYAAAMWALKNKKHVGVQKPLCNTIDEVRKLHTAAKEAGVKTTMGNQGRTMEGQRLAKEWIEQGALGKLREIKLFTNRPIWPQGILNKKLEPKPAKLDWDLWLGVEPSEPYFEFEIPEGQAKNFGNKVHPFNWRGWWQFGSGALGDMGCHIMDATFSILGQNVPTKIEVESGPYNNLNAPLWASLVYHMPATDKHAAIKVTWQDGKRDGVAQKPERDPRIPEESFKKINSGMMIVCEDGVILADDYCTSPQVFPVDRYNEIKKDLAAGKLKKTEARSRKPNNPQLELADCIVNGGEASSNFNYSVPLTEFVLLGNLAVRSGQAISWDTKQMKVTNIEAANAFVKRPGYRPGFI